ncbi:hypothetical protein [Marinoscillum sp.]|uniref:hypothetical protein n=1 Tax=Marinoscillum sp. TaxID=2024838 RepID=UPI003BAC9D27
MTSGFSRFWHKLTHWEYWPFGVLYFPVYFYFTWLAIRCRSFFFFTAANPSIDFGGMLGESKDEIFKLIPNRFIPEYSLVEPGDLPTALSVGEKLNYPLICKPDIGERGNLVEVIGSESELEKYLAKCPVPFLMQELIDYSIELGVFFVKIPGESKGKITSIVQKDFLHVIGDGQNSVEKLLRRSERAMLQLDIDHPRFQELLDQVPNEGQKVIVEPIGNHCRGTTFLNQTGQVTPPLNEAFNQLANEINGFYFGRFDLRCKSFEKLERLESFKILELNGAGAEPGHIYQPGYPLWKGYQAILQHLKLLAKVSRANHKRGVKYWTLKQGITKMRAIKAYNKIAQKK